MAKDRLEKGQTVTSKTIARPFFAPSYTKTIPFDLLSTWRADNPAIWWGYRPDLNSWKSCRDTLFEYHNETVNIWVHLSGSMLALACLLSGAFAFSSVSPLLAAFGPVYPFPSAAQPSITIADTAVFGFLFFGALVCFGLSAVFHLSLCHSVRVVTFMRKVDYLGVFFLGYLNFIPSLHYGFYCHPLLRNLYVLLLTVTCGVGAHIVLAPAFQTVMYRRLRTWVFFCCGAVIVFPFGHAIQTLGYEEAKKAMAFKWVVAEMSVYFLGGMVYSEKFPEVVWPGRFDFIGSSHQLLHISTVVAVALQYAAAREGFLFRHVMGEGLCGATG